MQQITKVSWIHRITITDWSIGCIPFLSSTTIRLISFTHLFLFAQFLNSDYIAHELHYKNDGRWWHSSEMVDSWRQYSVPDNKPSLSTLFYLLSYSSFTSWLTASWCILLVIWKQRTHWTIISVTVRIAAFSKGIGQSIYTILVKWNNTIIIFIFFPLHFILVF